MDGAQAEAEVVDDAASLALQEAAAAAKVERMNVAARGIRPGGKYSNVKNWPAPVCVIEGLWRYGGAMVPCDGLPERVWTYVWGDCSLPF